MMITYPNSSNQFCLNPLEYKDEKRILNAVHHAELLGKTSIEANEWQYPLKDSFAIPRTLEVKGCRVFLTKENITWESCKTQLNVIPQDLIPMVCLPANSDYQWITPQGLISTNAGATIAWNQKIHYRYQFGEAKQADAVSRFRFYRYDDIPTRMDIISMSLSDLLDKIPDDAYGVISRMGMCLNAFRDEEIYSTKDHRGVVSAVGIFSEEVDILKKHGRKCTFSPHVFYPDKESKILFKESLSWMQKELQAQWNIFLRQISKSAGSEKLIGKKTLPVRFYCSDSVFEMKMHQFQFVLPVSLKLTGSDYLVDLCLYRPQEAEMMFERFLYTLALDEFCILFRWEWSDEFYYD